MLYFHYYYYYFVAFKKKEATQGQCCHVKEKATHGKNHSQSGDQVLRLKLHKQAVNCPGIDLQMRQ